MAFEVKKFSELFETMRGRSTVLTDFEVGSVTRTLVESFAYEMAALYEKMNLVYLAGFVDTAEGLQLDQVVAVLGIQRNLPDYAEGEVSFFRDAGNSDITVPLGTLVATEDTEEKPRKTYVTLEEKAAAPTETEIKIKVRAFERGEEQVTAAGAITVMPRPIPGIKEVINSEATRFLGKRRETDDELRRRAKNALIQSGKATQIAIENALLSAPGIKEALVKEYFHFARGKVNIERISGTGALTLPKGSLIEGLKKNTGGGGTNITKNLATNVQCRLLEELRWDAGSAITFEEVGVEALTEAEAGVLLEPGKDYTWTVAGHAADLKVTFMEPLIIDEYGVIHVLIDGPVVDGTDPEIIEKKQEILALIQKWRAAGIYVYLKNVKKVSFGGIFRIAIDPALKLTDEDRRAYEQEVEAAILLHLDTLRVGETLKFPKLFQQILGIDGIDNVEALRIRTLRQFGTTDVSSQYELADNQVTISDEARFDPAPPDGTGYISVASADKALHFDVEFKSTSASDPDIDDLSNKALDYLGGSGAKTLTGLMGKFSNVAAGTFKLKAVPWSPRPVIDADGNIDISFVEFPVVQKMFAYKNYLDITGAVKIKFPGFYTSADKVAKINQIRADLNAYLDSLNPEESIDIPKLEQITKQTPGVLDASVEVDDFQAFLNNVKDDTRVKPADKTILVDEFEKARFQYLLLSGDVPGITLERTQLEVQVSNAMSAADQNTLKTKLATAFNTFGLSPGQNIVFNSLKAWLESAAPGLTFTLTQLAVKATSADNRIQVSNTANPGDIHVRSLELPAITPITASHVTLITV